MTPKTKKLTYHSRREQNMAMCLLLGFGTMVCLELLVFAYLLSSQEQHAFVKYWQGVLFNAFSLGQHKTTVLVGNQKLFVTYAQLIHLDWLVAYKDAAANRLLWACVPNGLISVAFSYGAYKFFESGRQDLLEDRHLRGGRRTSSQEVYRLIRKRKKIGPYQLAGFPIPKGRETRHFLFLGSPGSGKSQAYMGLMECVQRKGDPMIVYDSKPEFIETFYRPGDIILNPFDKRSPAWSPWQEIQYDYDYTEVATVLIPSLPSEKNPYFSDGARAIFESVLRVLDRLNQRTNANLYYYTCLAPKDTLHTLVKGTEAATYFEAKEFPTVRSTLINALRVLKYLRDSDRYFSVREWVASGMGSSLYILSREDMLETLRPLTSLWISSVSKSLLSLEDSARRRIWLMLDEMAELHPLDAVVKLMQKGRSRGLCAVLGLQNMEQLDDRYGDKKAKVIRELCSTWLILSLGGDGSPETVSKALKEAEVETYQGGRTVSSNSREQTSLSENQNRRVEMKRLVLASEITALNDREAFIRFQGDWPIFKTTVPYRKRLKKAPVFIEDPTSTQIQDPKRVGVDDRSDS